MLKFFNANQKNSLKKLELILYQRKLKQQTKSATVKKILFDVKKYGDKAVIKYEKKFSKIKSSSNNIKFSKDDSIDTITFKLNEILEKMISSNPEQWIWTHNRWKL